MSRGFFLFSLYENIKVYVNPNGILPFQRLLSHYVPTAWSYRKKYDMYNHQIFALCN